MREKIKCEAKYGDKKCENSAEYTRISNGELFSLCGSCAKLTTKQIKANNKN